jgi:hypothetical protein
MTYQGHTYTFNYPHPDECYYCGTHNPTAGCSQRNGERPCTPRRLLRGSSAEVRAAVEEFEAELLGNPAP